MTRGFALAWGAAAVYRNLVTLPTRAVPTLYNQVGDILVFGSWVGLAASVLWGIRERRRRASGVA